MQHQQGRALARACRQMTVFDDQPCDGCSACAACSVGQECRGRPRAGSCCGGGRNTAHHDKCIIPITPSMTTTTCCPSCSVCWRGSWPMPRPRTVAGPGPSRTRSPCLHTCSAPHDQAPPSRLPLAGMHAVRPPAVAVPCRMGCVSPNTARRRLKVGARDTHIAPATTFGSGPVAAGLLATAQGRLPVGRRTCRMVVLFTPAAQDRAGPGGVRGAAQRHAGGREPGVARRLLPCASHSWDLLMHSPGVCWGSQTWRYPMVLNMLPQVVWFHPWHGTNCQSATQVPTDSGEKSPPRIVHGSPKPAPAAGPHSCPTTSTMVTEIEPNAAQSCPNRACIRRSWTGLGSIGQHVQLVAALPQDQRAREERANAKQDCWHPPLLPGIALAYAACSFSLGSLGVQGAYANGRSSRMSTWSSSHSPHRSPTCTQHAW
jgi:hypothetical protein